MSVVLVVLVCATVLGLAAMALVHARENRAERREARTTKREVDAVQEALVARIEKLEERADGWEVTKRQVTALTEQRKR